MDKASDAIEAILGQVGTSLSALQAKVIHVKSFSERDGRVNKVFLEFEHGDVVSECRWLLINRDEEYKMNASHEGTGVEVRICKPQFKIVRDNRLWTAGELAAKKLGITMKDCTIDWHLRLVQRESDGSIIAHQDKESWRAERGSP